MSVVTHSLGNNERVVCQTCAWSAQREGLAVDHVVAFPDHRVLTVYTSVSLTMTQEQTTNAGTA